MIPFDPFYFIAMYELIILSCTIMQFKQYKTTTQLNQVLRVNCNAFNVDH